VLRLTVVAELRSMGEEHPIQFLVTKQASSTSEEQPDPWAWSSTGREVLCPLSLLQSEPEPELKTPYCLSRERYGIQNSDAELEDNDYLGLP
jgi:hypothetical protein